MSILEIIEYLSQYKFKLKKGYEYSEIQKDKYIMNIIDNILDNSLKDRTIREKILLILDYSNINNYICENNNCNKYKRFNLQHFKWYKTCCKECKNKKIKESNLNTYSKCDTNQFDNIKNIDKLNDIKFLKDNFLTLDGYLNTEKFYNFFNCSFMTPYNVFNKLNIPYKKRKGTSLAEEELFDFINNNSFIKNKRISNMEFDLYSNDLKFAIEYDGLMFHSFGKSKYNMFNTYLNLSKKKSKHLEKTIFMEKQQFQLFHIFENEWKNPIKQLIWKSVINNKLGNSIRIGARKCIIKEVQPKESKIFLDCNHLQGNTNASINIGLYYQDELISLMTIGKSRYNKNIEYELYRFCNKINYNIQGAASKLLKYFEINYKPKSIISYANRRWSQGNLYYKLGFDFIKNSKPNKFYFKVDNLKLESRIAFQKHKLPNKLDHFDKTKSDIENIFDNEYRIIYDCGNKTFIKNYI